MQSENLDVLLHVGEPPPSRLVAQRLGQAKAAAYASPDYVRRFGALEQPADLVNHRCLLFRPAWSIGPVDHWNSNARGCSKRSKSAVRSSHQIAKA